MRCRQHIALLLLLACCLPAFAQDITTQPRATTTTGSTQMDTNSEVSSLSQGKIIHGINVAYLESHIQQAMNEAIAEGELPGGIVSVIRGEHRIFQKAYGNRALEPQPEPATVDTIYDLASLTKPIATATSIMKLVEQGRLRLTDPVTKYISSWKNTEEEKANKELLEKIKKTVKQGVFSQLPFGIDNENEELLKQALSLNIFPGQNDAGVYNFLPRDRESITIRHLLVHTSGLPSFLRYYEKFPEGNARDKIIKDISRENLRGPVGGQFIYSDLGYIVLGELVERISGLPLEEFSKNEIFEPLGMNDTMFTPPSSLHPRIAPTEWTAAETGIDAETTRAMIRGRVHDGNAFVQGGVSGHAGLFSTIGDLETYFMMMLRGGVNVTNPAQPNIFSPITIDTMTQNHADLGDSGPGRGYGWDLTSSFSSLKGEIFLTGYGHTGFTGTSVWVVPEEKLAIIILSNRVHPNGGGNVTPLRAKIANIVAGSIVSSYRNVSTESK